MTKAEIQLVRSLDDKRGRAESGLFIAEGAKLVRELLGSHFRVHKVYCTGEGFGDAERVTAKEMERISRLKTPSDCLALVEIPKYRQGTDVTSGRLVLALDEVQNPGNMGTIIRLADWFGIGDILCSENSADCFNPKVVQATMGAIARVRVHYGDLAAMLSSAGTPVFGTFLDGENIYEADLPAEGVIMLGNEGQGISDAAARLVTRRLLIPPYPADRQGSESLNVAVAAAVVISEFRRRQL